MAEDQDDIGASGKSVALENRNTGEDGRRYSPSAARNREAIADILAAHMPVDGHILEIASGTGEHGAAFTERFEGLRWTYSDLEEISLASQKAWVQHTARDGRLRGPIHLDASESDWGDAGAIKNLSCIFCANMIHIAPFEAAKGMIAGAGRLLPPGGKLLIYGPFARNGAIAESNARFDADLKRRDESWGVRDLEADIVPLAERAGLSLAKVIEMPANNLSVILQKA